MVGEGCHILFSALSVSHNALWKIVYHCRSQTKQYIPSYFVVAHQYQKEKPIKPLAAGFRFTKWSTRCFRQSEEGLMSECVTWETAATWWTVANTQKYGALYLNTLPLWFFIFARFSKVASIYMERYELMHPRSIIIVIEHVAQLVLLHWSWLTTCLSWHVLFASRDAVTQLCL